MSITAAVAVLPAVSEEQLQAEFHRITPELNSRLKRCARSFPDREEALAEMLAFSWKNFQSKAQRTGQFLPASALAWVSWKRLQSGRVMSGYSTKDVLAAQTFRSGRARVLLLSQLRTSNPRHVLTDRETTTITNALSTRIRERPEVRAQIKIDWAAFCDGLPSRLRRVVRLLAIGHAKKLIARRIGVSAGRLSQILYELRDRLIEFFGAEEMAGFAAA